MPPNYPIEFVMSNVVLFGPQKSGKTKLLEFWRGDRFYDQYIPTIGLEFGSKYLGQALKLQLWDTSGDEEFRDITRCYFRKARIGLYCIDLSKQDKTQIKQDLDRHKEEFPEMDIILVGTKADILVDTKGDIGTQISELQTVSEEMNLPFVITSAKSGFVMSDLEGLIIDRICRDYLKLSKDDFAQLQKDVDIVKQIARNLPEKKGKKILQQLDNFAFDLNGNNLPNLAESLNKLITQCELEKNPQLTRPIVKIATSLAIILGSALLGFSVGFGIGFLAGAWTGPGAFISALLVGSKLAYMAVTMGAVGGISGGLAAHTLFKDTNNGHAQGIIENELLPELGRIKAKMEENRPDPSYRT